MGTGWGEVAAAPLLYRFINLSEGSLSNFVWPWIFEHFAKVQGGSKDGRGAKGGISLHHWPVPKPQRQPSLIWCHVLLNACLLVLVCSHLTYAKIKAQPKNLAESRQRQPQCRRLGSSLTLRRARCFSLHHPFFSFSFLLFCCWDALHHSPFIIKWSEKRC